MKKYYNEIYQRVNQFLFNKGYNPMMLKKDNNDVEVVLFADNKQKMVFAISLQKMDNTLYLLEGALFTDIPQNRISCCEWRACNIPYSFNINIDDLISQFETDFEQYMSDGIEFMVNDNKFAYQEMKSGITFENPYDAICKYAKQTNHQVFIWLSTDKQKIIQKQK